MYFESVRPSAIYEALNHLKRKNKFYKDITISYGLNCQEILNLPHISAIDETEADSLIVENKRFEPADHPLNAHRAAGYETTLVPEIPRIIEDDNVIMGPGKGKTPVSVLNDNHSEELAFPYLFPTEKFGYKVKREIPFSPVKYFNQRLLNFRQSFASDADYMFFARSIVEQHHLRSSINISLHK